MIHSQLASTSPANTAAPGDSTLHSGNSWWPNWTRACGGPAANPSPGSGPASPARPDPRPSPGSSETTSISARPPTGLGPDRAITQPRVPPRSSPAPVNPVTSQPSGIGQGSQTGTTAWGSRACRPAAVGLWAGRKGCTVPCRAQRQALCQTFGSLSSPWQRGQIGAFVICNDVDLRPPPRQAPGGPKSRRLRPGQGTG